MGSFIQVSNSKYSSPKWLASIKKMDSNEMLLKNYGWSQVARCLLLLYRLQVVEKTLVPKLFHLLSGLMPELFETRELIVQF